MKVIVFLSIVILWFFFTYKLTDIPPGINQDEAAIFYSASLIADTGRDMTGRFLPFLVTTDNVDYHKPVNVYLTVAIFKLFGVSYFNARVAAVILGILSCLLVGFICYKYAGKLAGFLGIFFIASTPIIVLQTHLALENIAIVPFTAIWLLGIWRFSIKKDRWSLFLIALGLTFIYHSYNAGRFFTPIWIILSYGYAFIMLKGKKWKSIFFYLTIFFIPLLISISIFHFLFRGSTLGVTRPEIKPYLELLYGYISNFDLSFLFFKGDKMVVHSVKNYGMFLVALLPFFLVGIYEALIKRGFALFVLVSFLVAPLFFGTVDSLERASRLTGLIPQVIFISVLGFLKIMKIRQWGVVLILILGLFYIYNFVDFTRYYFFFYRNDYKTQEVFTDKSPEIFAHFAYEAKKRNLNAYIEDQLVNQGNKITSARFFSRMYFGKDYKVFKTGDSVPNKSLVLSLNGDVQGLTIVSPDLPFYHLMLSP